MAIDEVAGPTWSRTAAVGVSDGGALAAEGSHDMRFGRASVVLLVREQGARTRA
jgi:hypothetical protein